MTLILGIESSCDETAASIVEDGRKVLSSIVASQDELHLQYGGVVPEIASRAHLERILPVIEQAILQAGITLKDIDAIAVGNRPGLIGSLLVGVSAAKSLSWSLEIPLICVDHVIAHLWAPNLSGATVEYPALGIVVSGGHTSLLILSNPSSVVCIGKTIDDAAGEAFDKASAILELGWPGGSKIDTAASKGTPLHHLPRPKTKGNRPDYSFSGLKTALLYGVRGNPIRKNGEITFPKSASDLSENEKNDWAASFQQACVDSLINGIHTALDNNNVKCLVAGGGVLSNSLLRKKLEVTSESYNIPIHLPEFKFCVDNAAMISGLGYHLFKLGQCDQLNVTASPKGLAS
ncbi:MAG: tRNA (adenosine(37)-N6)-threonylcarbamoyltransferase complex transferase subunit TsaD [Phycisphaerales bacterium]|jgi:N6-L-threonylcarbamoyladenine synthase|nr:tRNA (adenosine(37)-N6)-threonylcarbamoyltransferase complex transferase subunit TsaD [Phycisphaerales bacterium]